MAALSRSPFVTAHAATLSPHAGTAFGWRCHQPALKGEVDASKASRRRGYKAAHCSLFISTPQSRLAPCPLPGRGAFLVWCKLKPKAVPAGGESGHERSEWPKGERLGDTKCRDMFPFRHGLRRDTFPVNGDGLNCSTSSVCSAVPLAERSFQYPSLHHLIHLLAPAFAFGYYAVSIA